MKVDFIFVLTPFYTETKQTYRGIDGTMPMNGPGHFCYRNVSRGLKDVLRYLVDPERNLKHHIQEEVSFSYQPK